MKSQYQDDLDFVESSFPVEQAKLAQSGIYYITGTIEQATLLAIHQDILLKHLNPHWNEDIQIIINSPGGDVSEGWSLIDLLKFIKMDVRTIGMGGCYSLGACLLACGTKGKRSAAKNCSIMIHGMSSYTSGNKQQMVHQMKWVDHEHQKDIIFWLEHSVFKTSQEVERNLLDGFDKYFTAEEALKCGIIDFIQVDQKLPSHISTPKSKHLKSKKPISK